jgi:hypothetical protein
MGTAAVYGVAFKYALWLLQPAIFTDHQHTYLEIKG